MSSIKKKIAYCTIVTKDYIHYALTLYRSLANYDADIQLKIFVSDTKFNFPKKLSCFSNVDFLSVGQLCIDGIAKTIYDKYAISDKDKFRWSMKSVLISYLLDHEYDQVFYLDSDLYFFSSFEFLSEHLDGNAVLLTPHWRSSNPKKDKSNFILLQTCGLFNAGFIGVSKQGKHAMEWWADICAYKCKKEPKKGFFDDQAYLDLLPVYFDKILIENNRGCNVANWNQVECKRVAMPDGKVRINGEFDIVFIHFTASTIKGINSGGDSLLRPFLSEYLAVLKKQRSKMKDLFSAYGIDDIYVPSVPPSKGKIVDEDFKPPKLSVRQLDKYHTRSAIYALLKDSQNSFEGTVLEVGYGWMPYKSVLNSSGNRINQYIGLDLENNPIFEKQSDIAWKRRAIPLDDNSIDGAICAEVIIHCSDPNAVLNEIQRVLKPGGMMFISATFLWQLNEIRYDEYRNTPFYLERLLINNGFGNIKINPLGGWDASLAQMMGLWVRRRPIGKRKRLLLSVLATPVIYFLHKNDSKLETNINDGPMITGLSGTAIKK